MLYKVKLKNADDEVLLDDHVYEYLTADLYLKRIDFINNLRKHSSGCAVFQKTWKKADGGYKTETIYLHKLIAEKFLIETKSGRKKLVGAINGINLLTNMGKGVIDEKTTIPVFGNYGTAPM